MSRRGSSSPKLELKLNLSPPRDHSPIFGSPNASESSSNMSIDRGSCLSSEEPEHQTMYYQSSPEAKAMMLAGCPRCLMYVMLSESDPKCPKCKSTVLLDFIINEESTKRKTI